MVANYLKIALRSIRKSALFSLINISGLAVGISASLVIYLIVQHEMTFDTFHRDGDRIYRVVSKMEFPNMTFWNSGVPLPLPAAARGELTGLEAATHFRMGNQTTVTIPSNDGSAPAIFRDQGDLIYADSEYCRFFDYRWIAGDPQSALMTPDRVVLTRSKATMYFGSLVPDSVLGRTVIYNDTIAVSVSGIVDDLPRPTDFEFGEIASLGTIDRYVDANDRDAWGSVNSAWQFFVKLVPGIAPRQVADQIASLRERHQKNQGGRIDTQHFLEPLAELHFSQNYGVFDNSPSAAHKPTLYGLMAVAAFLLALGCINFVNLSTARGAQRAKEIGVRKTMGSNRAQLIAQFLGEAFVLTLAATVVSLAMVPLLLDIFRNFLPTGISYESLVAPHVVVFLSLLMILITGVAGSYPAFVLSRLHPIAVLRSQVSMGRGTTRPARLRKVLTVLQFSIAQFLIIATLVVGRQILYSIQMDLGYRRNAIVTFNVPFRFSRGQWPSAPAEKDGRPFVLLERLRALPGVAVTSLGGPPPASGSTSMSAMKVNNGHGVIETTVEVKYGDTATFSLYGLRLLAGNGLRESDTTREYVINATYAKVLGFAKPEDALGHFVERGARVPIVGVMEDFHSKSTHVPIKPLAYTSALAFEPTFHLRLNGGPSQWHSTLKEVESEFRHIYPDAEFSPKFFDEEIQRFYETEQRTSQLLAWSSGLAVFISCLGLLGLAVHTAAARTKEIGVRKVLGASVSGIVVLLSREFVALVLFAFIVAAPAGWWVMNDWLADYAYRASIGWWVFAATGGLAMLAAALTISVQAIRSATANPVEALRYE